MNAAQATRLCGKDPRPRARDSRGGKVLITGGAGFIGTNLASRYLSAGTPVLILDNLSRAGVEKNLRWLQNAHGDLLSIRIADVRNARAVADAVQSASVVFHLAAQVAVTTSLADPLNDSEINIRGALNVLEALRAKAASTPLVFTSTNRVYGALSGLDLNSAGKRYRPVQYLHFDGIDEHCPLDFHSPYGCSKGTGDQYVRDYHRIYGLRSVVLRQSCIYGPRQFGVEDQGWVAWMIIAAQTGKPITIYGDGKQIRDLLYVEDLLDGYDAAITNIEQVQGQVFNLGGGSENTMSIWTEFGPRLEKLLGHPVPVAHGDWRPGDQKVFVADIRKAQQLLGWKPKNSVDQGVKRLCDWVSENKSLF